MPPGTDLRQFSRIGNAYEIIESLGRSAYLSPLTELPNRVAYREIADQYDSSKSPLAVAYMDLTGFSRINNEHGHDAGDAAIRESGNRLRELCEADNVNGSAYHLSGDEFVVLFDPVHLEHVKTRFEGQLTRFSFAFQNNDVQVRANLGIALPESALALDTLKDRADKACVYAKRTKATQPVVWTDQIEALKMISPRLRCEECAAEVSIQVEASQRRDTAWACPNCRSDLIP